jgi:5-methyltetrahydrofolate--homocysteine methyltransferase
MQIIGEKINGTRKRVAEAIAGRDGDFIRGLAREQAGAGANLLDVNAGTAPGREPDDLVWLVKVVQEAVTVPLCLDSTNPLALNEALKGVERETMINSINGDRERLANILPIVVAHNCTVIGLAMDESGIPKDVDGRMEKIRRIFAATLEAGLPDEKVYVDPLIMAISTDAQAGLTALESIRAIRREFPEAHITSGLSNISFGLPARSHINRTFLTLAIEAGLDSAIADPTNRELWESLLITEMLLGRDPFCRRYTKAFKAGRIGTR